MSNSGVDHQRMILPNRADGYKQEEGILVNTVYFDIGMFPAHAALYSTTEDLYLWDQALYTTELVSQESLDAIFTPHSATNWAGCENTYGYGWSIGEQFGYEVVGHSGSIFGFTTYIHRFAQEDICIIILSNFHNEIVNIRSLRDSLSTMIRSRINPIINPMLVAHWTLDETQGDTANDSVGNNDANLFGDPVWQPNGGKIDGALAFDGTDDYISTSFILNPRLEPFSVFAWIKADINKVHKIISQKDMENLLYTNFEGKLITSAWASDIRKYIISQEKITPGQWHHVGLVWDGLIKSIYLDGVEVAQTLVTDEPLEYFSYDTGLHIGASWSVQTNFFSGLIDDVRLYNAALSPEEIAALAQ